MFTLIKEVEFYKERLEPNWLYSNPNDQWLFAETVTEFVGTEFNILYVYDDNTYIEEIGLDSIPMDVQKIARHDLDYDDIKRRLKRRRPFLSRNEIAARKVEPTILQQVATEKAQSYLACLSYSYSRLVKQLQYNGFTAEEAQYAVDHCGADWRNQACREAQTLLNSQPYSYSRLIGQLEYQGFSTEDAHYAVEHCGADWHKQAYERANLYLQCLNYTKPELIRQLQYEGFTDEQAIYGATILDHKQ